jgi:dihydrofolate reductase
MFTGKSAAEVNRYETEHFSTIGTLILGRRMADLGIGPWGEEPTFHAPCFVVTHRPADTIVKKGGTSYIFVTDGPEAALAQAKDAAGSEDVLIIGGADVARQYLNAGLIDEIRLHVAPLVLGAGTARSRAPAPTCTSSQPKRPTRHSSRISPTQSSARTPQRDHAGRVPSPAPPRDAHGDG